MTKKFVHLAPRTVLLVAVVTAVIVAITDVVFTDALVASGTFELSIRTETGALIAVVSAVIHPVTFSTHCHAIAVVAGESTHRTSRAV